MSFKLETSQLKGKQIRAILKALIILWKGDTKLAETIRLEGTKQDLVYDLIAWLDFPGLISPKAASRTSFVPEKPPVEIKVVSDRVVFWWTIPSQYSQDPSVVDGQVLLEFIQIGDQNPETLLSVTIDVPFRRDAGFALEEMKQALVGKP